MARVVRPRPLSNDERIPIYWPGSEPSAELKAIDGGALYRYLLAGTPKGTNRRNGERYRAPKEGGPEDHASPRKRQQQKEASFRNIAIPQVREVEDYHLNQEAIAATRDPQDSLSKTLYAAPYVRHQELLPGMYEDQQHAEYDMDEQDEELLNKLNAQGSSFLAATLGLCRQVAARLRSRDSSHTEGAVSPEAQGLTADVFEAAIDKLELLHMQAVKQWWEESTEGPSSSVPTVPKIPAIRQMVPVTAALGELAPLIPDPKKAKQIYDHWSRRRGQEGGPLLQRLWFELPWKLVAYGGEDGCEDVPFSGDSPRSTQRGGIRRRVNDEDAIEALQQLRNDLEIVRTLADQVRKREKTKRLLLSLWRQGWHLQAQHYLLGKAAVPDSGAGPSKGPMSAAADGDAGLEGRSSRRVAAAVAAAAIAAGATAEAQEVADETMLAGILRASAVPASRKGPQAPGSKRVQQLSKCQVTHGRESPKPVLGTKAATAERPGLPSRKRTRYQQQQQKEEAREQVELEEQLQQQHPVKLQRRCRLAAQQMVPASNASMSVDEVDLVSSPDSSGGSDETYHGSGSRGDMDRRGQQGQRHRRVSYTPSEDDDGTEGESGASEDEEGDSGSGPASGDGEKSWSSDGHVSSERMMPVNNLSRREGGAERGPRLGRPKAVVKGGHKVGKAGLPPLLNGTVRRSVGPSQGLRSGGAGVSSRAAAAGSAAVAGGLGRPSRVRGRLGTASLVALAAQDQLVDPQLEAVVGPRSRRRKPQLHDQQAPSRMTDDRPVRHHHQPRQRQQQQAGAMGAGKHKQPVDSDQQQRGHLEAVVEQQQQPGCLEPQHLPRNKQWKQGHKQQQEQVLEQVQRLPQAGDARRTFRTRTRKAADADAKAAAGLGEPRTVPGGSPQAAGATAVRDLVASGQQDAHDAQVWRDKRAAAGEARLLRTGRQPSKPPGATHAALAPPQRAAVVRQAQPRAPAAEATGEPGQGATAAASSVAAACRAGNGLAGGRQREKRPRQNVGKAELRGLGLKSLSLKSKDRGKRKRSGGIGRGELAALGLNAEAVKDERQMQDGRRITRKSKDI